MYPISEEELSPYRPIPFYFITTHDPAALTYAAFFADLSDMKAKGYGGIVLFNRPPEGFTEDIYFTEPWFAMVENCLAACRDLELRVWLNDDYTAPPGTIGGRLPKLAPHLQPLRLRLCDDGSVSVEEVPWGFPAFEEPESALLFQKYVYEEYKRRFGAYFGTTVVGFFSDADSRRVNSDVLAPHSPMKDYFPWSKHFRTTFEERYGYDITPYLPSVLRREPSPQSRDYWEHSGELYMGWFQSNYKWCQKNGLRYTFHTSDSAPFRIETTYFNSVFAEGKAIDAGTHCDYPGTDHEMQGLNGAPLFLTERFQMPAAIWGGDDSLRRTTRFFDVYSDLRAKQAQSCAYLHDKKGVMCEMFAATNWNASYRDLRNIAAWQILQGVNFIVYHAYHYRLHGDTKFFAPPAFGPHSHLDCGIRAFNDLLAAYAYRCSIGKLRVDFALLDPTDTIWAGTGDSGSYLALAEKLNRFPQGYILSDIKGLRRKAHELRAVINPGLTLSEKDRAEIYALGLPLLEADEITTPEEMEERFHTGIRWHGNGAVLFMRRICADGQQLCIIGNIENAETIVGSLYIDDTCYSVSLSSGELAFFGAGQDSYHAPLPETAKHPLAAEAAVTYGQPNYIPLMRWEDTDGRAFSLLPPDARPFFILAAQWIPPHFDAANEPPCDHPRFPFTAAAPCRDVELCISERYLARYVGSVLLDEKTLTVSGQTTIFDDSYAVFRMDIAPGRHTLGLTLTAPAYCMDKLYLRGNFGVDIQIDAGRVSYGTNVYCMQYYLPEKATVTLDSRPDVLRTDASWATQGNPFYSGTIDYRFSVQVPDGFTPHWLVMDGLRDAVEVFIDGKHAGSVIVPPYRVPVTLSSGTHAIVLRVTNTLGNRLDGYLAPSGLLETPYLL